MFFVQGFSQYTSLPALAARIAAVACQFGPVAISTASMSLRASSSRKSRYVAQSWLPYFASAIFLTASRRAAFTSQTATNRTSGSLQEAAQVVAAAVADADAAQRRSARWAARRRPCPARRRESPAARPAPRRPAIAVFRNRRRAKRSFSFRHHGSPGGA